MTVSNIHPNASGFDLDSYDPNIIGEVKGCIPVNQGKTFGAAQLKGLTNDVLQMLGRPPSGKEEGTLSKAAKIHRTRRTEALKFLALYDSPEVKAAVNKWRQSLLRSRAWKGLDAFTILDLPESGQLTSDTVYLVYLTPSRPINVAANYRNETNPR